MSERIKGGEQPAQKHNRSVQKMVGALTAAIAAFSAVAYLKYDAKDGSVNAQSQAALSASTCKVFEGIQGKAPISSGDILIKSGTPVYAGPQVLLKQNPGIYSQWQQIDYAVPHDEKIISPIWYKAANGNIWAAFRAKRMPTAASNICNISRQYGWINYTSASRHQQAELEPQKSPVQIEYGRFENNGNVVVNGQPAAYAEDVSQHSSIFFKHLLEAGAAEGN